MLKTKTPIVYFSTACSFILIVLLLAFVRNFRDFELYEIQSVFGTIDLSQEPGLRFVSPLSTVRRYNTRVRSLTLDKPAKSPELKGIDCRSQDAVHMGCV